MISRERVLRTALRLADEHGLERLTMRRLGAELGVDPMAIYHHVADKAALFDGLVESIFAEIEVPPATGGWPEDLRAIARSARATMLAHPGVVALVGTRPAVTEPAFRLAETIVGILLAAGFSPEQASDGFDSLGRMLIGHVLAEAGVPPGAEGDGEGGGEVDGEVGGEVDGGEAEHAGAQSALPADRFPSLAAIERAGVRHDPDRLFELGLDGVILVIEGRAAAGR